jgi:hypothetical protein
VWDSGNSADKYLEVRPGKLATNANLTVKKTLGLIYSVWFIGGPTITIDAGSDSVAINNMKGLFSNSSDGTHYKFYNVGDPKTQIVIKKDSVLHKYFVDSQNSVISGTDQGKTVTAKNTGTPKAYTDTISGFPDWDSTN